MALVARDFDSDEIVIRIRRGPGAGGFARFLEAAADAVEYGKIAATNPVRVADEVRRIATDIQGCN
jgi:hypothetical protein